MIALDRVCHFHADGRALILNRASAAFAPGSRTAILAAAGTGKSTLARLIAGQDRPRTGRVRHIGCLPPQILGSATAFYPWLTGEANLRLLAAIAGASPESVLALTRDMTGLGCELAVPLASVPAGVRARLAFALSYALPAPWLLADEVTATGGREFRSACDDLLAARLARGAGLILITSNSETAARWGENFLALAGGRLIPAASAAEASGLAGTARNLPRNEDEDESRTLEAYA
jgi:capsular polysaccharide transport system ATP-binding protein